MNDDKISLLKRCKTALERGHEVNIKYLPYTKRHRNSGFKVGDYVRVKRMPESYEDGWDLPISPILNDFVGNTYEIVCDKDRYGFQLKNEDYCVFFPFFCLEPAKVLKLTMEDIAKKFGAPVEIVEK